MVGMQTINLFSLQVCLCFSCDFREDFGLIGLGGNRTCKLIKQYGRLSGLFEDSFLDQDVLGALVNVFIYSTHIGPDRFNRFVFGVL